MGGQGHAPDAVLGMCCDQLDVNDDGHVVGQMAQSGTEDDIAVLAIRWRGPAPSS